MSFPLHSLKEAFGRAIIPTQDAIEFIKYYQSENPVHYAKSIWLDDQVFEDLFGGVAGVDGIRLYYAKYKQNIGQVDRPGGPVHDTYTVILALTEDAGIDPTTGVQLHRDKVNCYYDYGKPCRPSCNGGLLF